MSRTVATVGVVGLGTMGAGIAEVFARNGIRVVGVEADEAACERGRGHLQRSTARAVSRSRLDADEQQRILGRLTVSTSLDDLRDCDLVVEAVVERMEAKLPIFRRLDDVVAADAVLATNTSSLSVTEIAAATAHPERVLGMHFFNPAPVQRLVEVVHTVVTDEGVVADVVDLARRLGKLPVSIGDHAGFIANALLFGYLNHAMTLLQDGVAARDDIDQAMRIGAGYPMGPFALLDLIGLDTSLQILETMHAQSGDRLHAPAPVLRHLVAAGLLGRKTGRGFADYSETGTPSAAESGAEAPIEPAGAPRVCVVGVGEAADAIATALGRAVPGVERVGSADDAASMTVGDTDIVLAARDVVGFTELPQVTGVRLVPAARTPREGDPLGVAELSSGPDAEPSTLAAVRRLWVAAGWQPVVCQERAGGVVGALLLPYLNDAARMVSSGYASEADVDTAMTHGCALPAGPFAVLDRSGVEAVVSGLRTIHAETGEPGHVPAPLLVQRAAAEAGRPDSPAAGS